MPFCPSGTDNQSAPAAKSTSLQDLTVIEAWDSETNAPKYVTFYHITDEAELGFGQSSKNKRELTLDEYYIELTTAPDSMDCPVYIKRPSLNCYETMKGTPYVPRAVLDETLILEKISKTPHPNIVKHYVRLHTLSQYINQPAFQHLDKARFLEALVSAVAFIHSLGLAHNDINPDNIMIGEDGLPVLLDFGSCAPYGQKLQSLGTRGWYEKLFFTSEKEHDDFALNKMRV
ncbi:Putative protein kinase [Colletotrichum destructivum]|uniref:Protein kinase domain-containing protein n=1 Tax=Colletotrichum destructivum TaxID=34406 RepID=A0AAX4I0S8_9PEZI|nr:Putative protein kinase [Colletotrichum destructivum]